MRAFATLALASGLALLEPAIVNGQSASVPEDYPPIKLRGYGTLSGHRSSRPDHPKSSVLKISCDSEDKARLVLAKYLSDLSLLPGVTPVKVSTGRGTLTAWHVEGQGVIAAVRCKSAVHVATAADSDGLGQLDDTLARQGEMIDASEAEVAVPMYLDRWDKYGFRFYYGPFVRPDGADHREVASYDPRQDFEFAEHMGHAGLVVWHSPFRADTDEGIADFNSRRWVLQEAVVHKLPFGVNLGLEESNLPLINRYPADMVPNADQYVGGWYGALNFGGKTTAWSSAPVQDIALGQLQPLVRQLNRYDNVVNWLEPHEEMGHGNGDLLDDHGPPARDSFRNFLRLRYQTPDAVARRWGAGEFKSWEDVPLPEVASFLGWNADAIDLIGPWKISYDAPYGAESAGVKVDDSAWPTLQAPGHAIVRRLPRKPATFRRHFQIDPAWRAAHRKVWVYVWDLNDTRERGGVPPDKTDVHVFMNGHALVENPPHRQETHWTALEVSSDLVDGENLLSISLPQAVLGYRVYLSGQAPGVYPALGAEQNARWADYSDWCAWSRGQAVRRGAQMIRQVDPDRPITLMAPDDYMSPIKAVAEDYGGIFHDTGAMAGFWVDVHSIMMQSAGLPTDCEPGSGAVDLDDFKRFMGRWSTEGTQGIDYFQHVGDILWKPAVNEYFLKTQNLWHLIGKYHLPQAEVAILNSDRNQRLFGFPWNTAGHQSSSPDLILGSGLWTWGLSSQLLIDYPRAGLVEDDFARGNADAYRVVIDSNTTIMDPDVVDQIESWVRRGGIFVTYPQTGRHTSATRDAWPISKLTGSRVTAIDDLRDNGEGVTNRKLHLAKGQSIFHSDIPSWGSVENCAGLSFQKEDPACEELLQWDDGATAAGMRKLGKGVVIDLGSSSFAPLLPQILQWAHVKRVPARISDNAVIARHFVSNNELYDVWVLWNQKNEPIVANLVFRDGMRPPSCRDVNTGEAVPIQNGPDGAALANLALAPWETRAFLTPRDRLADAPSDWFTLQRHWWRGTADPGIPIPSVKSRLAMDLTDDWAFKPLPGPLEKKEPPEDLSLVDPQMDDSAWKRQMIGVFDLPENPDVHHAIFRRRFTVPLDWNHGRVMLYTHGDYFDRSREYLDGKPVHASDANDDLGGILQPGSTHVLAIEIWGDNVPVGTRTPVWISYRPDPLSRQALSTDWAVAPDLLRYGAATKIPVTTSSEGAMRCRVRIDPVQSGRNVVMHARTSDTSLRGLIFNGHWSEATGNVYHSFDMNVTPWVKFGEDNEVILVCGPTTLLDASIDCYEKEVYP